MKNFKTLFIFGPPGAGKGTIAHLLSTLGSVYHLSSGEMIRSLPPDHPLAKKLKTIAAQGVMVDDALILELLIHHIEGLIHAGHYDPDKNTLLLDGVPRTKNQAQLMHPRFDVQGIIYLRSDHPEVLLERVLKRSAIEGREDDTRKTFEHRLEIYKKTTQSVLHQYDKQKIYAVNAEQRLSQVLRDVLIHIADLI